MKRTLINLCRNILACAGLTKFVHAIRKSPLGIMIEDTVHKRGCFVQEDGRVVLPQVDIVILYLALKG
jgi:hypothetical protein